jgi:predicted alpha/beta hydrolase
LRETLAHKTTVQDPEEVAQFPARFPALDGYNLGGTLFAPKRFREFSTVGLLSCGGGILAARYARFAAFLAARGIPVLTYDYRGIGDSRPRGLRGFPAVAEDWSEFDCGGAIAYLRSRYARAELIAITHSIGALITLGAPNVAEISRFILISPHTGYYRDYLFKYRLPMALLWHGAMPALTHLFGYFPAKFLRLGEDIPAGIALQWAARRRPELRPEATTSDASRARSMIARYQEVAGPALVIGFRDDAFATATGMRRLLAAFPRLRAEVCVLAPSDVDMKAIGHFGFFRREAAETLWPRVVPFIEASATSDSSA